MMMLGFLFSEVMCWVFTLENPLKDMKQPGYYSKILNLQICVELARETHKKDRQSY